MKKFSADSADYEREPALHELGVLLINAAACMRKQQATDGRIVKQTVHSALEYALEELHHGPVQRSGKDMAHFLQVLKPVTKTLRRQQAFIDDVRGGFPKAKRLVPDGKEATGKGDTQNA